MFSSQIATALRSDPYVSQYFDGVFPCDKLPQTIQYPCAVVANTDPSNEQGEHWVAFHFDNEGNGEYFDSYGRPPENNSLFAFLVNNSVTCKCNSVPVQGLNSEVCGQYCISFLAQRARGVSMDNVVKTFRGKYQGEHDTSVARLVNRVYNIAKSSIQKGGKQQQQQQQQHQCCCSKLSSKSHRKLLSCAATAAAAANRYRIARKEKRRKKRSVQ